MKRVYLVDGYNLLHQFPELRRKIEYDMENARESLLARLTGFSLAKGVDISVVFDGSGEPDPAPLRKKAVRVRFSRPPEKADPLIKRMISERKKGEELILVSSDRDIGDYARLCGVKVESSQTFAQAMERQSGTQAGDMRTDRSMSDREIQEWMALFGGKRSGGPSDP
ncbi:NYN domain-containing protein [bacterium]|nr:NYN domain-containing protein [bacterium]